MEERERKLVEEEERLADYERLVLQSEAMAAEARRATEIRERERRVARKKEELRRRLAQAVRYIEESKGHGSVVATGVEKGDEEEEGETVGPVVSGSFYHRILFQFMVKFG